MFALPALSLPDPVVSGEGVLDPLGLANFGDRLAEELVPGVRARQNRIRFLTAIAVAAAVVEGLDDIASADGSSTPQLAFEWLLVEGLVRAADTSSYRGTAGTLKARDAVDRGVSMSAKTYLKTPTVFGFHGVYKTLADELRIVDDDLHLLENGVHLLSVWEEEQGLSGFVERAIAVPGNAAWKHRLRSAIETALSCGHSDVGTGWGGWRFFADHLGPSGSGPREAKALYDLLTSAEDGTRPDVIRGLTNAPSGDFADDRIASELLGPHVSSTVSRKLAAIDCYERVCGLLEFSFDSIRFAGRDPLKPATSVTFLASSAAGVIVTKLRQAIVDTERAIEDLDLSLQQEFHDVVLEFNAVQTPADLFEAVLARHHTVQSRKPPAGKRDWFERTAAEAITRTSYRVGDVPDRPVGWGRPYRLTTCLSFVRDLEKAGYGPA
jgi:hypothetical protein